MINNLIRILIISTLIVCTSCKDHEHTGNIISIDINSNNQSLSSVISHLKIHPLETTDSSIIESVTSLKLYHNWYYIFDRKQGAIFKYNKSGNFISKLHSIGRGPEEYLRILDFTVNPYNGNIEFVDGINLYCFDEHFKFIQKIKVTTSKISAINRIEIIDEDLIAFVSYSQDDGALIYSRKEKKIIMQQHISDMETIRNIPIGTHTQLTKSDQTIFYQEAFSNEIYVVDSTGYHLAFQWDFDTYNFDVSEHNSEFSNENRLDVELGEYYRSKYAIGFSYLLDNQNYLITAFEFRKEPTVLIYNRKLKKYSIFSEKLCRLFYNPIVLNNKNQLFIIIDTYNLKYLATEDLFDRKSKEIITELDISNNPVVLELVLKDNFSE